MSSQELEAWKQVREAGFAQFLWKRQVALGLFLLAGTRLSIALNPALLAGFPAAFLNLTFAWLAGIPLAGACWLCAEWDFRTFTRKAASRPTPAASTSAAHARCPPAS